jgi:hypothetical protein
VIPAAMAKKEKYTFDWEWLIRPIIRSCHEK